MIKHLAVTFAFVLAAGSAAHAQLNNFKVLYSFTDGADGGQPQGGVIQDSAGTLYGETFSGGTACPDEIGDPKTGCGTLYSFTPAGGLKVLVTFTGLNGARGGNGLTLVGNTLYGSTLYGGASDDGVLFSVQTDGTGFTLLHQFIGTDGRMPDAPLLPGPGGVLFGTTQGGGTDYPKNNSGTLFEITPTGQYTLLHSFSGGADGLIPASLTLVGNALVGTTLYGGIENKNVSDGFGTFFSYKLSNNAFSVLYSLPVSDAEGQAPYIGGVGPGPTLYVADTDNLFTLDADSGYVLLDQFTGTSTADSPGSGPIYRPGQPLIGTLSGGPNSGLGSVYMAEDGVVNDLYEFGGASDGGEPLAQPIITPSGAIIGTASIYGDCYDCGTIWEYTP